MSTPAVAEAEQVAELEAAVLACAAAAAVVAGLEVAAAADPAVFNTLVEEGYDKCADAYLEQVSLGLSLPAFNRHTPYAAPKAVQRGESAAYVARGGRPRRHAARSMEGGMHCAAGRRACAGRGVRHCRSCWPLQ